jgi:hypothetical protein
MRGYCEAVVASVLCLYLFACGQGGPAVSLQGGCPGGECGKVKLYVDGSKSFNPSIDHGRIEAYRVAISGPGIEGELTAVFPGDADSGLIEDVPAGEERVISVSAINPNATSIREGETEGVSVSGGEIADVEITMESVPIFTNIADGSVVENTRLIFHVFSDPSEPVAVEDVSASKADMLVDAPTSSENVSFDVDTGLGTLAPAVLMPGEHSFKVRNLQTGRSSSARVRLLDGSMRKGAPLFSASDVTAGILSCTRVGDPWSR